MRIKLLNTLSEKKEILPIRRGKPLRFFVCGPTVYDFSHIGHARTYLTFDIFVRYLRAQGISVFYLQNITDIDDKIIERARTTNKTAKEVAQHFFESYREDMKSLGITSVTKYAPASQFIKEIQKQITVMIKKGIAYQTSSGVYFEVKKFPPYGKLSKQNLSALRPGYRIEPDAEKKDPLDFALWKLKKSDDEPSWPSPWGEGRPGWHIEDTAISERFFGPQYEIHGGGMDLKFPHHESEIAQQESVSGKKPFVKIWLHTGFLLINGEKMSKSLGNFITIRDFLKNHSSDVLRFITLSHHYRSPIDLKDTLATQTQHSLVRIKNILGRLNLLKKTGTINPRLAQSLASTQKHFQQALGDDFNTPSAIATLFHLINETEPQIWKLNKAEAKAVQKFLITSFALFGLKIKTPVSPANVKNLLKKRELYRANKQFTHADDLRKEIEALGYLVEDTPLGPYLAITK
ncbi:MAG TPA: cysteine--tRNA ligase [Candidatus Paceibacterota bacterium]